MFLNIPVILNDESCLSQREHRDVQQATLSFTNFKFQDRIVSTFITASLETETQTISYCPFTYNIQYKSQFTIDDKLTLGNNRSSRCRMTLADKIYLWHIFVSLFK